MVLCAFPEMSFPGTFLAAKNLCRRIAIVKALKIADKKLPLQELADMLGCSRAMVSYYLSNRVKTFYERPPWAGKLFAAASLLGYNDPAGAAGAFRQLADMLEQEIP